MCWNWRNSHFHAAKHIPMTENEVWYWRIRFGKPFSAAHCARGIGWKCNASSSSSDSWWRGIEMKAYLSTKSIHDYPLAYYSFENEKNSSATKTCIANCHSIRAGSLPHPLSLSISLALSLPWHNITKTRTPRLELHEFMMTILHRSIGNVKPFFNCTWSFVREIA